MPFRSTTNQRTTGQPIRYSSAESDGEDFLSDDGELSEQDVNVLNAGYNSYDSRSYQAPAYSSQYSQSNYSDSHFPDLPDATSTGPTVPPRRTSLRHRESVSRAEAAHHPSSTYNAPSRKAHAYQQSRRPLVDFIKNEWQQAALASHAPKATDDYDYPLWIRICFAPRFQRGLLGTLALFFFTLGIWKIWVAPLIHEGFGLRQSSVARMRNEEGWFGQNLRPEFEDMIQLDTLDETLVPGAAGVDPAHRLVVIGDVHGCNEELNRLLTAVSYRPKSDHLIFTGDMIAKGPGSPKVLDLAISHNASCVRGNHEDRVLLTYRDLANHPRSKLVDVPPSPGVPEEAVIPKLTEADQKLMDDPTLDEEVEEFSRLDIAERALARQLTRKHIDYLSSCPIILDVGAMPSLGNVHVAHAGLVPSVSLDRQDPLSVMHMRTVDLDTHVPSSERKGTPWYKLWNKYQSLLPQGKRATVIYGHDSRRGLRLEQYSKGIDTGCVKGGKLTALVIDAAVAKGESEMQAVSVDCKDYSRLEREVINDAAKGKTKDPNEEGEGKKEDQGKETAP